MLYKVLEHFTDDVIFTEGGPLISLYQPTHRHFPDNKKDSIVYKNLITEIEDLLKQNYDSDFIKSIMKPFYEFKKNRDFWNNTLDGIAILASQNKFIVYNLHKPVKKLAVVADSFYIKPLLQAFQLTENYHLLALSRDNFKLYKGNKYGFKEVEIDKNIPRTLEEVLGRELTDPNLMHGSHAGQPSPAIFYGASDTQSEIDKDTEKYFNYVDSIIFDNYSKKAKLPVIILTLAEHQSQFRSISKNPYLLEEGISKSPESLDLDELEKTARKIIDDLNIEKIKEINESYALAKSKELASDDFVEIAKKAYEGRVQSIIIEEGKIIPGKIDTKSGNIELCEIQKPGCNDILDQLAKIVLTNGGDVLVLNQDNMPSITGVAAIYRFN